MKTCTLCGDTKPLEDFHKASPGSGFKDGRHTRCKTCHHRVTREALVRRQFGMSLDELEALRSEASACAICGTDDVSHADHDHEKPGLRGFLCQRCNMGLGLFRDRADFMRAAAEYLDAAVA